MHSFPYKDAESKVWAVRKFQAYTGQRFGAVFHAMSWIVVLMEEPSFHT